MLKLMKGSGRMASQIWILHTPRQLMSSLHTLRPSLSVTAQRQNCFASYFLLHPEAASQVWVRGLHDSSPIRLQKNQQSSSNSFTDGPPTSTHVFRIKHKVALPEDPNAFSLTKVFSAPAPYLLYGLGGLIPFMFAPYHMHVIDVYNPEVAHWQLVYGACILSFLGGVSWGDHLRRSHKASLMSLGYSIVLPLIAWPAVLMFPNPSSFVLMMTGIMYGGYKDTRDNNYPQWFRSLRFWLTSLVTLSLGTTLLFSYTKKHIKSHKS